ncbi:RNA polymerase sigma factor [Streptomyces sp. NPDC059740]|uniref:RNA polymerase sigma factor n=1 Tax=Streptomyces sp. NPDC059740 TaxID=3346926 RepID=UPI003651E528
MSSETPQRWDRRMQQRLTRGEAAALGELYDRFASLVHSLAHRVLDDDADADRVTREVFSHIWQHPDGFDPRNGSLRSWVAGVAHRQAVQRLRQYETASARREGTDARAAEERERKIRAASTAARADYIVTSMPAPLREALELAHFQRRTCRQTAEQLGVTEDEARRRLRLGLQLLSTAAHHTGQAALPPPGAGLPASGGPSARDDGPRR